MPDRCYHRRVADSTREDRARARALWSVRRADLADDGGDVMTAGTPSERVAMVWALTLDAWAMSGKPIPDYRREVMPGRLVRIRRT